MDLTAVLHERLNQELQNKDWQTIDYNKLFLGFNFNDDNLSRQVYDNTARVLGLAVNNEQIDKTDMLVAFSLLTKQTLFSSGLGDTDVIYVHKTQDNILRKDKTFYSDSAHTVSIFFEDIIDEIIVKKLIAPEASLARVMEITKQISHMQKAVESAKQFELFRVFIENPNLTPPSVYLAQKQYLAKALSVKKGKFLSQDLLAKMSKTQESGSTWGDFANYGSVKFSGDDDIRLTRSTNPNTSVVAESFKASLVISNVLDKLSKEERDIFKKDYPAVFFAYNDDGKRKTLHELLQDRDAKIMELLKMEDEKQLQLESNAIGRLYETIIESDAILCLQRCLNHIKNISWSGERYFVPKNDENKYSPSSVREEIKLASEKAQAILDIVEDDGAEFIEPIIKEFEQDILEIEKNPDVDKNFFEDKKQFAFAISNQYFKNDDLVEGPKDKGLLSENKRKEYERAVTTLKIVFPTLMPNPTIFGVGDDGKYNEVDNIEERIMLDIAWENYRTDYVTKKGEEPSLQGIEPIDLQRAIRLVYPYNDYSFDDRSEVEEKIRQGEITLVPNLYEIKAGGDGGDDEELSGEFDYNRFFFGKNTFEETVAQVENDDEDETKKDEIAEDGNESFVEDSAINEEENQTTLGNSQENNENFEDNQEFSEEICTNNNENDDEDDGSFVQKPSGFGGFYTNFASLKQESVEESGENLEENSQQNDENPEENVENLQENDIESVEQLDRLTEEDVANSYETEENISQEPITDRLTGEEDASGETGLNGYAEDSKYAVSNDDAEIIEDIDRLQDEYVDNLHGGRVESMFKIFKPNSLDSWDDGQE